MTTRKYICPACKQKTGVKILYGMPSIEVADAVERGEIVLGGCCLSPNNPELKCTSCGHKWRKKEFDE